MEDVEFDLTEQETLILKECQEHKGGTEKYQAVTETVWAPESEVGGFPQVCFIHYERSETGRGEAAGITAWLSESVGIPVRTDGHGAAGELTVHTQKAPMSLIITVCLSSPPANTAHHAAGYLIAL